MNYPIILKILSMLFAIMSLAFAASAGVSVYYSAVSPLEGDALPSWISAVAFSALLAFSFFLPSRTASGKLFKKEAMCIVGVGWTLASLLGTLPYVMILDAPFCDAFFESASGLTTTGSSVFGDFSRFPRSLMFWRCLSHWIGGLGVVVFFVAIFSFLGSGGRTLYSRETSVDSGGGMDTARIRSAVFGIIGLYLAISAACAVSFRLCSMGWFDAVCHMFSTVSTGGFSVYSDSISHYDSLGLYWVVAFYMFVGGIGFSVLIALSRGRISTALGNTELRVYSALIAAAAVAVALAVWSAGGLPFFRAFTYSVFNTVSVITTTGFMCDDYQKWIPFSHAVFFVLMIIGGCSGSTSGGLKVSRLIVSFALCRNNLEKSFRPRVVRPVKINGRILDSEDADKVLCFLAMFALIALVSIPALSALEPSLTLGETVTGVVASLSNTGPAFGRLGPADNFGFMGGAAKIFLGILMIMGRLEFYAILALFMPSLWRKFQ